MSATDKLAEAIQEMVEESLRNERIEADDINNLDDAIESYLQDHPPEVDADDVTGLERFVENAIENATIEADNINGLDEAIRSVVGEQVTQEQVNGMVANALRTPAVQLILAEQVKQVLAGVFANLVTPAVAPAAPELAGYVG
jgi:hypothetical protein